MQNKVVYEGEVWLASSYVNSDLVLICKENRWKNVKREELAPYTYFWQCREDALHYQHNLKQT